MEPDMLEKIDKLRYERKYEQIVTLIEVENMK